MSNKCLVKRDKALNDRTWYYLGVQASTRILGMYFPERVGGSAVLTYNWEKTKREYSEK